MLESLLRSRMDGTNGSMTLDDYLNKSWLYTISAKNEDDEALFMWAVNDARVGYTVFRIDQPDDLKRRDMQFKNMQFQKWFEEKTDAIEYCYEQGKAEKLAKGL